MAITRTRHSQPDPSEQGPHGVQPISDKEFAQFQRFIYQAAGITLSPVKKALVSGRLAKRVSHRGLDSFGEYFRLLASGDAPEEVQTAVDLLTTNETYFFREAKHFDLLRNLASVHRSALPFRVWSAASSSGEEAYSIAMVLEDCMNGRNWEVMGSDISTRVLQRARTGHYPVERTAQIPRHFLKRFCLQGRGPQEGTILVQRALRDRVDFCQINLNAPLPQMDLFDVIFLRNVMIYFNPETKREVVARLLAQLRPGGYFLIGHSESLHGIADDLPMIMPAIYRKPEL